MSTTEKSTDELVELIRGDPMEVLREHPNELREMREETDNDALAAYIDALLEKFEAEDSDGGAA